MRIRMNLEIGTFAPHFMRMRIFKIITGLYIFQYRLHPLNLMSCFYSLHYLKKNILKFVKSLKGIKKNKITISFSKTSADVVKRVKLSEK